MRTCGCWLGLGKTFSLCEFPQAKRANGLLQACALGSDTTVESLVERPMSGIAAAPGREGTIANHPAHFGEQRGSTVCFATVAGKIWGNTHDATFDAGTQCDEWLLFGVQPGSNPITSYLPLEAPSVGIGQSSADDGTALVEDKDEHAKRAPLKPETHR